MSNNYFYCGLVLNSELPLPELQRAPSQLTPDWGIHITRKIPPLDHCIYKSALYQVAQNTAIWHLPKIAQYYIDRDTKKILVAKEPNNKSKEVQLFLLHAVMPMAMSMDNEILLTAATISNGIQTIAITGSACCGKSTLAASLIANGYRMLSDSVLRLTQSNNGTWLAQPQAPYMHLWPETIEHLTLTQTHQPLRSNMNLQCYPVSVYTAQPLTHIVALNEQPENQLDILNNYGIKGVDKFHTINHYVTWYSWIRYVGDQRIRFLNTTKLAKQCKVKLINLPWGWDKINERTSQMEQWLASTR